MKVKHILLATAAAAGLATVTSSGPAGADHCHHRRVIVREVVPFVEAHPAVTFVTPDTVWVPGSAAFVNPSGYRVVWVRVGHEWVRRIVWP